MVFFLVVLPLGLFLLGLPVFAVLLDFGRPGARLSGRHPAPGAASGHVRRGRQVRTAWRCPSSSSPATSWQSGGIAQRLIAWVLSLFGHLRGSLGLTTVASATLLGAISGSSPATVAAVGKTLQGSLSEAGYGPRFTAGLITSSGAIAIVVPPSIAMILYGASAEVSIPQAVPGRHPAGPAARPSSWGSTSSSGRGGAPLSVGTGPEARRFLQATQPSGRRLAAAGPGAGRHLCRLLLADRSRRRGLPLRHLAGPLGLPQPGLAGHPGLSRGLGAPDGADPDRGGRRRRLFVDPDGARHPPGPGPLDGRARPLPGPVPARHQPLPATASAASWTRPRRSWC